MPNHLITDRVEEMPVELHPFREELQGRALLVRRLRVLPVEAIVRGYITGITCYYLCSILNYVLSLLYYIVKT